MVQAGDDGPQSEIVPQPRTADQVVDLLEHLVSIDPSYACAAALELEPLAASCGYDVREPEEELLAQGLTSPSGAASGPKGAALAELSRPMQQMMHRATWKVLTEESLVKVIQQVYARLGLRITKAKLAQTVPAAGVVFSVGMNMAPVQAVARDAALASRLRFLSDKYGLDPEQVVQDARRRSGCSDEFGGDFIALN